MSNQDHICIAITKSNMGGAQKYVLTLADELHRAGQNVTVLAGGDGLLFEELEKREIPYIKLKSSQRDISLLKEFKLLLELWSIFKKIRPTILHLNSSKLGGIGQVIGRVAGIKKIFFTAHGWAFNETRPDWQKKIMYFLYWITIMLSKKTICVSNQTRSQIEFLPFVKNKLVTIYNGVPVPDFYTKEEARQKLHQEFPALDLHKKWIIVLAELHYTKGHDLLIEAVSKIKNEFKEYQIICAGTGELEGTLRSKIHHKDMEDFFILTGFLKEAPRYLKAFDLFILPSRTEALPLSLLEAGLAETLVIASNVGGIPEVIEDTVDGFLFEKENEEQLKEKVIICTKINSEEKEIYTKKLYTKIRERFSVECMITQTTDLYKKF
jgi:glycosyltransferase involved in cell wall biosynthesis